MTPTIILAVSALLIHIGTHAVSYRMGRMHNTDWREDSGMAVGVAALAAAFTAGWLL